MTKYAASCAVGPNSKIAVPQVLTMVGSSLEIPEIAVAVLLPIKFRHYRKVTAKVATLPSASLYSQGNLNPSGSLPGCSIQHTVCRTRVGRASSRALRVIGRHVKGAPRLRNLVEWLSI